jgi:uncharacterized protein YigE (DUF2233 family)
MRTNAAARQRCRAAVALVAVTLSEIAVPTPARAQGDSRPLPASSLAVRTPDGWRTFWRANAASANAASANAASANAAAPDAPLARVIRWRAGASGGAWGELELAGSGEAWRTRLVVARVRPERVRIELDTAFDADHSPRWTVDHAPPDAVLAVNAGQFEMSMPWGWVVLHGEQWLSPGAGPLSAALVGERDGSVRWVRAADIAGYRAAHAGEIRWAFQSYPVLVADDAVPLALRESGRGVDVAHRDARAAICTDHAGNLVVAVTRFDAVGSALGFIPFGLTSPEMAGIMRALGCRDAMLLDGGISAQLLVRGADGVAHAWRGVRHVPVGLVLRRR